MATRFDADLLCSKVIVGGYLHYEGGYRQVSAVDRDDRCVKFVGSEDWVPLTETLARTAKFGSPEAEQ